jgi:hypothetical protein
MRKAGVISVVLLGLIGFGLAGAGPASGAVLCDANENPCSAEDVLQEGAKLLQGGQIAFGGSLVCNLGSWGQITDPGGEGKVVTASMGAFFAGCSDGGFACWPFGGGAFTPYDMEFEGSGGNGSMVLSDPVAVGFTTKCPSGTCWFQTTEEIQFEFTGGSPAVMVANNIPVESTPGCPTTMSIELNGAVHSGMYLVEGPVNLATRLCKENTSPCPTSNTHTVGAAIEGSLEGNAVFEFLYEGKLREPACEAGSLTGKTTEAGKPLIGEVSALAFSKCGAGVCAAQAQALPYVAEIEPTTGGNGALALISGGSGSAKLEIDCGKAFKCVYKVSGVNLTLTGGEAPKLTVAQTLEKDAASEAECGSTLTWTATYKLTKPTPLFVT